MIGRANLVERLRAQLSAGLRRYHERTSTPSASGFYANQPNPLGITSRMAMRERRKMYAHMMDILAPTETDTVLDVGVTSDLRVESNFFEKWYPHKHRITATGLEDASFLEREHPGVKFVLTDGDSLPFPDRSFDLATSFAVLEHVGSHAKQQRFVRELCRVARRVYLTTPNRWFPIEYHTVLPLLHWLPPATYRRVLTMIGQDFFAQEDHLNLKTSAEVLAMFPDHATVTTQHHRLYGWISNLIFYAEVNAP